VRDAADAVLAGRDALLARLRPEDVEALAPAADVWQAWVCRVFLDAYRETVAPAELLPRGGDDVRLLLDCYQIEKALYELAYELNNRPTWTRIPLYGIRSLLRESTAGA